MIELNKIYNMDCVEGMKLLDDNSIDSIVTDPPYELGFMGKKWDSTGIAYNVDVWRECLRVLKPGGHLLAFGGTRTYHRMACAIEDAGFEIRDQIQWIYGSGFPKSHNISKAIDKKFGAKREVIKTVKGMGKQNPEWNGTAKGRKENYYKPEYQLTAPATPEAKQWDGWGTALKPAHEPIVLARKPLSEKTIADNVLKWGTGGINIDGCRIGEGGDYTVHHSGSSGTGIYQWNKGEQVASSTDYYKTEGRFPANVILDEEAGRMLDEQQEGVSRFFYCAKASRKERGEFNKHPTVKPIALMEYLIKLVTPPEGIVLDPFLGSGTTALAALNLGRFFIGIELNEEYCEIARRRIEQHKTQTELFA